MATKGAMIVIGSGPGIGQSTAACFARNGFQHIILLSRNESRLGQDAKSVISAAPNATVDTLRIDLGEDEVSLRKVLAAIDAKLKAANVPLEVVVYNAARVGPSKIMEWDAKDLEQDLRIATVSLYVVLQWAIPQLQRTAQSSTMNPAFLTTSGSLYRDPIPFLFSLAAGKASQYNLMHSFHKKFEPEVHVSVLSVNGLVKDGAKVTTPRNAAAQLWTLYEQPKGTEGHVSIDLDEPESAGAVEDMRKAVEGA